MKKQIAIGIGVFACVALCAAVWPRNIKVGDLPVEPVKAAVTAEIEARSEEIPSILFSADTHTPEPETVAENEPPETEAITAEEKTETPSPATPKPSAQPSSNPKSGDKAIIDGKPYIWIPGFEWIEDHSGESAGTFAADMYENGNKIGVMGGGTTVGNPGDELTGNKVGQMGGTTVGSKGDINKQVGVMGGEEPPKDDTSSSTSEQPEPTGDVIYIELVPTPTKDSTPPPYKPNSSPSANP